MTAKTGTLESLALFVARALTPLLERMKADNVLVLFAELGLQFPPELLDNTNFANTLSATITAIDDLVNTSVVLSAAIESEEISSIISSGRSVVVSIKNTIEKFQLLAATLRSLADTFPQV